MACDIYPNIIICGPTKLARRYKNQCEDCNRTTYWLKRFDGVYYGYTERCMACGSIWQDGERMRLYGDEHPYWRGLWNKALPAKEFQRIINERYNDE